ncbi:hypothetical protein F511_06682 [Dorcoceras hygrometricum]|uniref:Uncharacterized protein n=1 Tax=Dorcoceras hygrometricum TaxID=472368 RepID=A0A2Z7D9S9_9LAMI|nr:hypothetical protein F511_06682 [Dorcoceras hygrometricum]
MYAANLFMEVRSSISYIFPSFAIGKNPLEDFDCSDPRYNPLLRPAAARTPSNHHCTPVRKLRVSNSLLYCLAEKGYRNFFNVSVRKTI